MQFHLVYTACASVAGILLDLLVIGALLRSAYRHFPLLLLYVVVDFLTSVAEIRSMLGSNRKGGGYDSWYAMYWWNEQLIQVLVYLIVIALVYRATARWRPRRALLTGVVAATILFATVSFAAHFDENVRMTDWMVRWTRDLNFAAAILDLGLWAVLISSREKDYRILMIAAGLGIQFTGGAIGQAFRALSSPTARVIVSDLTYLTTLACLYIWWQAFRQPREKHSPK